MIYEQTLLLTRGQETLRVRRITIRLDTPNRAGETEIHLLTNLPRRAANAYKGAELYLERWTIESAFQELEQALRSQIDTLGYPTKLERLESFERNAWAASFNDGHRQLRGWGWNQAGRLPILPWAIAVGLRR